MSTKCLHTFLAGVGFVCVSQVTEACAQQMASLHPSACSALSTIGTDIDIEEFWLADWHWKTLTQASMLKISIWTVAKNTPNLLLDMAPILPMFVINGISLGFFHFRGEILKRNVLVPQICDIIAKMAKIDQNFAFSMYAQKYTGLKIVHYRWWLISGMKRGCFPREVFLNIIATTKTVQHFCRIWQQSWLVACIPNAQVSNVCVEKKSEFASKVGVCGWEGLKTQAD